MPPPDFGGGWGSSAAPVARDFTPAHLPGPQLGKKGKKSAAGWRPMARHRRSERWLHGPARRRPWTGLSPPSGVQARRVLPALASRMPEATASRRSLPLRRMTSRAEVNEAEHQAGKSGLYPCPVVVTLGKWPEKCRSNAPSLAATTRGR